MFAQPASLSRIHRRAHGARWLFALLILLKLAVGTFCLANDALLSDSVQATAAQTTQLSAASVTTDDDAALCWHDGAGGCHCNCMHATPLAGATLASLPRLTPLHVFAAMRPATQRPAARNPLRPPIALVGAHFVRETYGVVTL
ncbi:hypothetical protein [Dyella tabacisoli]|uniref:Uncharacterized protein n=1 Tax=Dyella tabacisoli TaxID=2282381 RepID=A0A369US63_9GAMM|nr:hypothetical protein [Dyella tabacisoli]RDD82568.1 hypothetical protein DVJ77_06480 [Dyella tabacisoli]